MWVEIVVALFAAGILYWLYSRRIVSVRASRIDDFVFPPSLPNKLIEKYPHITPQQADLVMDALRDYFHLCNRAGRRMVSMPSQAVDVVWHEFILFTRNYQKFCRHALGRFLHHTPAEAMQSPAVAQAGIKRAWTLACAREQISPKSPTRLPLLFAIDGLLGIQDGFSYTLDCSTGQPDQYCAGHIGCGGCGGGDGCGGGCSGD